MEAEIVYDLGSKRQIVLQQSHAEADSTGLVEIGGSCGSPMHTYGQQYHQVSLRSGFVKLRKKYRCLLCEVVRAVLPGTGSLLASRFASPCSFRVTAGIGDLDMANYWQVWCFLLMATRRPGGVAES